MSCKGGVLYSPVVISLYFEDLILSFLIYFAYISCIFSLFLSLTAPFYPCLVTQAPPFPGIALRPFPSSLMHAYIFPGADLG